MATCYDRHHLLPAELHNEYIRPYLHAKIHNTIIQLFQYKVYGIIPRFSTGDFAKSLSLKVDGPRPNYWNSMPILFDRYYSMTKTSDDFQFLTLAIRPKSIERLDADLNEYLSRLGFWNIPTIVRRDTESSSLISSSFSFQHNIEEEALVRQPPLFSMAPYRSSTSRSISSVSISFSIP